MREYTFQNFIKLFKTYTYTKKYFQIVIGLSVIMTIQLGKYYFNNYDFQFIFIPLGIFFLLSCLSGGFLLILVISNYFFSKYLRKLYGKPHIEKSNNLILIIFLIFMCLLVPTTYLNNIVQDKEDIKKEIKKSNDYIKYMNVIKNDCNNETINVNSLWLQVCLSNCDYYNFSKDFSIENKCYHILNYSKVNNYGYLNEYSQNYNKHRLKKLK